MSNNKFSISTDIKRKNVNENKYSIAIILWIIQATIVIPWVYFSELEPIDLFSVDITNLNHIKIISFVSLFFLGSLISMYEFDLLKKVKPFWGCFKKIMPYMSILLVLIYYPGVDTKISSIVHESADFFTYARYHLVLYFVLFTLLSIITCSLLIFLLFLSWLTIVEVSNYTSAENKKQSYLRFLRVLFYAAVNFILFYVLYKVIISIYYGESTDRFVKEIIVASSFGHNTACLDDNGEVFKKQINYLDRERISVLTIRETNNIKDYVFSVEKCIRD